MVGEETFVSANKIEEEYYTYDDTVVLTENQIATLKRQDLRPVSNFHAAKAEAELQKRWDQFYNRNKDRFFKDRHWIEREWPELLSAETVLEAGCGAGNLLFPLMSLGVRRLWGCDLSPRAVELVRCHPDYHASAVTAFQTDITQLDCWANADLPASGVSVSTLVFVLSAVPPAKMTDAVKNLYNALRPSGLLLFRDYGRGDMAQMRFGPATKISENCYLRQDGTQSYFFSLQEVREMFCSVGFQEISLCYVHRRTINKKEGIDVPRIFIQGKFSRPS